MQFIKPDVRTICCGIAMSMGSVILAGGAPGKRQALPNSRILIHQPTGGFQGQASDIEIHAREALYLRERLEEIYSRHTGQPTERLRDDMDRDRFFTPEQAKDYGLIDHITNGRKANGNGNGNGSGALRRAGPGARGGARPASLLLLAGGAHRRLPEHEPAGEGGRAEGGVERVRRALRELRRDARQRHVAPRRSWAGAPTGRGR